MKGQLIKVLRMKILTVTAVFLAVFLVVFPCNALSALSPQEVALENKKIELENKKIELEMRKLRVSTWNALIAAGGLAVPLLVAVATLRIQVRNRNRQDQIAFRTKVAEIVMNTDNPTATRNRAKMIATLFPTDLKDLNNRLLDPELFEGDVTARFEFLKIASPTLQNPKELADLWRRLFPNHKWTKQIIDPEGSSQDEISETPRS